MPGGDRTGPMGAGPRTGRAAGYCAGYGVPGYANPYGGRGMGYGYGRGWGGGRGRGGGRGFGRGRGYGWQAPAPFYGAEPYPPAYGGYAPDWGPAPATAATGREVDDLRAQVKYYSALLRDLKKRLEEIETDNSGAEA